MEFFSERNGLREPIKHTYKICHQMYNMLFDCCEHYLENLAWRFPHECADGYGCSGTDMYKLNNYLLFAIPTLYRSGDMVSEVDLFVSENSYDQFALLDYIEFIFDNIKDIKSRDYHSYYQHYHLTFCNTNRKKTEFRDEINRIFKLTGLMYELSENGRIERLVDNAIVSHVIEYNINIIREEGVKELLNEALELYKKPQEQNLKFAVEKLWDAFERMKTYYDELGKNKSTEKIINDIANGRKEYCELFESEFRELTTIGNKYRIRHHETDVIDIDDKRYYDYFFNRCLSLIALAIQYLE